MAVKYGFFNSVAQDRKYDAIDFDMMFDGLIIDGVFERIGAHFAVTAGTGMQVLVDTGRAWFNYTWTYNDASLPLTIAPADLYLPRIDSVILETDTSAGVRANSIKVLTGTPASSPVPPTLTHTTYIHQYPLAYVSVPANITQILSGHLTNKVGSVDCPYALLDLAPKQIIAADIGDAVITTAQVSGSAGILGSQLSANANIMATQLAAAANILGSQLSANAGILGSQLASDAGLVGTQITQYGLTDYNMGQRVPTLAWRQGGDTDNWNLPGFSNYMVDKKVKTLMGAASYGTLGAGQNTTVRITFPNAFTNFPLVFVTLHNNGVWPGKLYIAVVATTTTWVDVTMWNETNADQYAAFKWLAIGPNGS